MKVFSSKSAVVALSWVLSHTAMTTAAGPSGGPEIWMFPIGGGGGVCTYFKFECGVWRTGDFQIIFGGKSVCFLILTGD